jgi:hypothetical protein
MSTIIVIRRSLAAVVRLRSPLIEFPTLATAALILASPSTAVRAADLPAKAPTPAAYNWSGCYAGLNGGGGGSGTSFTTTIDPGTHLIPADAVAVSTTGTGSTNDSNFLAGGQAGCNWQSGTLVYGLEGDFDYIHSTPQFKRDEHAHRRGHALHHHTVPDNGLSCYSTAGRRRRSGPQFRLHHRRGGIHQGELHAKLHGWLRASSRRQRDRFEIACRLDRRRRLGIRLDRSLFRLEYLFASFPTTSTLGAITDSAGGVNTLHGSSDLVIQIARAGMNFKF